MQKSLIILGFLGSLLQAQILTLGAGGTPATPIDSPGAGTYSSTQSVTLTDSRAAFILYTLTGTAPSCPVTGTLYTGAFNISTTSTLKAIGCSGGIGGGVLTSVYTITGGSVTWTLIQHPSNYTCTTGACAVTTASTTAGNLLVVLIAEFGVDGVVPPIVSNSVSGDGTWTECPTNWPQQYNYSTGNYQITDCFYRLSAAGGATTLSVTPDFAGGATEQATDVEVLEYHRSTGTASLDVVAATTNASCTSCTFPSASITGTDVVILFASSTQTPSAIGSPWTNPADVDTSNVFGAFFGQLSVSSYSAPSLPISPSGSAALSMVSFK